MGRRRKTRSAGVPGLPGRSDVAAAWRKNADGTLTEYIGISGITTLKNSIGARDDIFNVYGYAAQFVGTEVFTCASITGKTVTAQYPEVVDGGAAVTIGSGQVSFGVGQLSWFTLDSGEKYILQSEPAYLQSVFFDVNGVGEPLVLSAGTGVLPICTAEAQGSHLLAYGFEDRTPTGVNKAFDPDFDGLIDGNYYWRTTAGASISNGRMTIQQATTENQYISCYGADAMAGKWYRVIINVTDISAGGKFWLCNSSGTNFPIATVPLILAVGVYSVDFYSTGAIGGIGVKREGTTPAGSYIVLDSFQMLELLDCLTPVNPVTRLTAAGTQPSVSGGDLKNCPVLIEAIPATGWFETDTRYGVGQYFNADQTPKRISPQEIKKNHQNAEFSTDNNIVIYTEEKPYLDVLRIARYFKDTSLYYTPRLATPADNSVIRMGLIADPHYRSDAVDGAQDQSLSPSRSALLAMSLGGANGVVNFGDIYHGSYVWFTDADAQKDISEYESLFLDTNTNNIMFVTGNHDSNVAGSYEPFWNYSDLAAKNSVITVGNYDFINFFDVNGEVPYTSDAESFAYLSSELEAARTAGRESFICVHAPLKTGGVADATIIEFVTTLSTAINNGAKIRGIFAGHIHAWESIADFQDLLIPMITLKSVSYQGAHYYIDVTSEDFLVTEIISGVETIMSTYIVPPAPVDLVTDGSFDSGTAWTAETGWEIVGGVAHAHNFAAQYKRLSQPIAFELGGTYKISGTCTEFTGTGQIYLRKPRDVSISDATLKVSGVGPFSFTITVGSENDALAFANNNVGVNLKIDNVKAVRLA